MTEVLLIDVDEADLLDYEPMEEDVAGPSLVQGVPEVQVQDEEQMAKKLYWKKRKERSKRNKQLQKELSKKSKPKASVKSEVVVVAKQAAAVKQPGFDVQKYKRKKTLDARRRARQRRRIARRDGDREVRRLMGDPEPEGDDDADMPKGDTFANIGKPACFWDELSDDDLDYQDDLGEPEAEDEYEFVPKKHRSKPEPESRRTHTQKPVWASLRPLELRAMTLARRTSVERELVRMPFVSKAKAAQKVKALRALNPPTNKIIVFGSKTFHSAQKVNGETEEFLKSIYKYHFFSFDTEGNGELTFTKGPKQGQKGRSILVIGNPAGEIVIFYDPSDISQKIRDLFADATVLKLQSGIDHDVALLPFRIFGIVDTGCFVPFLNPSSESYGIKTLHDLVYPDGPKRVDFKYFPFKKAYENENLHHVQIKPADRNRNHPLVHSIQDVLTPIAAVFHIGGTAECFPDEDRFPLMNDLLELCWAKCPSAVSNQGRAVGDLWISDKGARSYPSELNSQPEVQRVRAARQHFYEGRSYELERARYLAELNTADGPHKADDVYLRDCRLRFFFHCRICGTGFHQTEECTKAADSTPCCYPHLGVKYPDHILPVCPALHAWCRQCWVRGHETSLHSSGRNRSTAGQLRRTFYEAAPFGMFTSAIFLQQNPDDIKKSFYRAGFLGNNRIWAPTENRLAGQIHPFDEIEEKAARRGKDKAIGRLEGAIKEANLEASKPKKK